MPPARKLASYQDVLDAPANMLAQVIHGVLHLSPRPANRHSVATSALGDELGLPFKRGRGGPGGWILLDEPELHLGADILVPDMAGWRKERMAKVPNDAFITLAPDWVAEVLSPSTAKYDRTDKLDIYARESVKWAWLIDPVGRTLEALRHDGEHWTLLGTWRDDARFRAEPFEAIEFELAMLWDDMADPAENDTENDD